MNSHEPGFGCARGVQNAEPQRRSRAQSSNPADTRQQTAIPTLLSDMDTELAALEARRDKTRALKQGMMQALLTGRIRLVSTNALPTIIDTQPSMS